MNEFEMSLGKKFDKDEIKRIIKEREEEGYHVMSGAEAELFYKNEKAKYLKEQKIKDKKNIANLIKKKGFV